MSRRRELPKGALPVRIGQVWRDRDKRSPYTVEIDRADTNPTGFVYYRRHTTQVYRSRLARFVRAFDFVSNPPSTETRE